jgi:hypothetical protein
MRNLGLLFFYQPTFTYRGKFACYYKIFEGKVAGHH